ncbi:hypothetical protein A9Q84_14950 [Halobacteriovorax marinus]|uniref:NADPH-dependent FMN reductase-like domain-containing protein n=1 Tax=Halobacteriovorax marinus TaxID=97084 RepID=A0A1Y5F558_9BACT|nr:hypothetical protein A9Q84_14950 [Halobacteriovorax marinus]
MSVSIIVASQGQNLELANKLKIKIEEAGKQAELIDLVDLELPLYSGKEEAKGIPEVAKTLFEKMKSSKGLVFVAPEYNGSLPPTLNNAIAWVSRADEDFRQAFNNKPVLLASHSGSGGINLFNTMRTQFSYLGSNVLGRSIRATYQQPANDEDIVANVSNLVDLIN